ncbi:S-layer homology domain-containing protein [Cytobacillus oceanisediminis]|uniref:S-layer homology domain-containing protein n=1 Tax=Cytobacillus oceanisediminis TaxID=665099 RepID=UPI0037362A5C
MQKNTHFRKFVSGSVTAAVVASAVAPAASAEEVKFTDIKDDFWAAKEISTLVDMGIINGYPDNTFKPSQQIIRGQAANLLAGALNLPIPTNLKSFPDVSEKSVFAEGAAATKEAGIFGGNVDGTFGAGDILTREQMASVLVRAFDLEDTGEDVTFVDWHRISPSHRENVKILAQHGITTGKEDGTFDPKTAVNRATFVTFLYRAMRDAGLIVEAPAVEIANAAAVNSKTVELTGNGLHNLEAGDFVLAGNQVASYKAEEDGKKATLVFEESFKSGEEQLLKVANDELTADVSFTYTFEVESVEATTVRVDDNTEKQMLGFTVNGEKADLDYLKEAGFEVEFQATKDVFADDTTGELDAGKLSAGTEFSYKVVLTNGDTVVSSELVDVNVVDFAGITADITDYTLYANGQPIDSGKIALQDENVKIDDIVGTLLDGTKNAPIEDAKFSSSNNSIAVINSAGEITPVKPGNVTFTIKSGDATATVPVTIEAAARTAAVATPSVSTVKLVNGGSKTVNLTVADQYGDILQGFDLDALTVENADGAVIATTTNPAATNEDGKTSFTISADAANVGNGKLQIKNGNTVLATIDVTVGAEGTVASRQLELGEGFEDAKLDIVKGSDDTSFELTYNKYNSQGILIGPETSIEDAADYNNETYKVVSSNPDVATVSVDNGTITVNAGTKAGTAQIRVMEGTVTRATLNVQVVNSTPVITNVSFEEDIQVTKPVKLDVDAEVLKPANVTTSTGAAVSLSPEGVLYVEVANEGYSETDDITLGRLAEVSSVKDASGADVATSIVDGFLGRGDTAAVFQAGDTGEVVLTVTRTGETAPLTTSTVTVDVE